MVMTRVIRSTVILVGGAAPLWQNKVPLVLLLLL
jgi:hypothetical protein